jgi:hypothetical protein
MEHLEEWNKWLSPMVPIVPDKNIVINELRLQLEKILG